MNGMTASPITELNDRARDVFRAVVESYIDSGAPVGSRTISQLSGLHLSPASIRGVMQELEELGLLAAPYTSARSEEHTSELQSLMRISYAVFCLKKKNIHKQAGRA